MVMPTVPARASSRPPMLIAPSTASPAMIHTLRHLRLMIVPPLLSGYLEIRSQVLHRTPAPGNRPVGRHPKLAQSAYAPNQWILTALIGCLQGSSALPEHAFVDKKKHGFGSGRIRGEGDGREQTVRPGPGRRLGIVPAAGAQTA